MRVAILEDDRELAAHLTDVLRVDGYQLKTFGTGAAMVRELGRESFDLLLLDWQLPDMSGIEVLEWSRRTIDPAPPAIMVTSRADDADIVRGLDAGAADYVTKPVVGDVLRARVRSVLRRAASPAANGIETFGPFAFDVAAGTVHRDGVAVALTAKELALALLMFRNMNRPLSRSHIMEAVWGRSHDVATRTLDVHISLIRNRLVLRPENGVRLASVYSFGYRLEQVDGGSGA